MSVHGDGVRRCCRAAGVVLDLAEDPKIVLLTEVVGVPTGFNP
jgi:hypothetical protein